jgi:hypothetical protein
MQNEEKTKRTASNTFMVLLASTGVFDEVMRHMREFWYEHFGE